MRDKPILFSAAMVKAILAGGKTQTRRVLKDQSWNDADLALTPERALPNYMKGDRLWVRENFGFTDDISPRIIFAADGTWIGDNPKWTPSIHMPRARSRITLTVTQVRVQRLQWISETDALAEGVNDTNAKRERWMSPATRAFEVLWDSLNAKRGYGWDSNPFVVAVTFFANFVNIDRMEE